MKQPARKYIVAIADAEKLRAHHLSCLTDLGRGTQSQHAGVLRHFLAFMRCRGHGRNLVLTERRLLKWMTTYSSGVRPSTAGVAFQVIARYLKALTDEGLTACNLMSAFKLRHSNASWRYIAQLLQSDHACSALACLVSKQPPHGPFRRHIRAYINLNRAVGKSYDSNERVLLEFDRFLGSRRVTSVSAVTTQLIEQWIAQMECRAICRAQKAGMVKQFFHYLVARGVTPRSPVGPGPKSSRRLCAGAFRPYIYTKGQVAAILAAARQLPKNHLFPLRSHVCYTLFAILYALGLRLGEARRLRICDVDLQQNVLFIRQTKFHKSRMVPFGPRLAACLRRYLGVRHTVLQPVRKEDPLFVALWRRPVCDAAVGAVFHKLLSEVGLAALHDRQRPRIHDLRHTFAVHRLLRWYRQGADVQSRLMLLSTFMGHVEIRSTEVYLTVTTELLSEANARFRQQFGDVTTEETSS